MKSNKYLTRPKRLQNENDHPTKSQVYKFKTIQQKEQRFEYMGPYYKYNNRIRVCHKSKPQPLSTNLHQRALRQIHNSGVANSSQNMITKPYKQKLKFPPISVCTEVKSHLKMELQSLHSKSSKNNKQTSSLLFVGMGGDTKQSHSMKRIFTECGSGMQQQFEDSLHCKSTAYQYACDYNQYTGTPENRRCRKGKRERSKQNHNSDKYRVEDESIKDTLLRIMQSKTQEFSIDQEIDKLDTLTRRYSDLRKDLVSIQEEFLTIGFKQKIVKDLGSNYQSKMSKYTGGMIEEEEGSKLEGYKGLESRL